MKKLLLLLTVATLLFACNGNQQTQKEAKTDAIKAVTISNVLEIADKNIGKEVYFQGTVNHVCSHSGRRCILIDSTGNLSIRVEAGGKINGFNRELVGMKIAIKGTLQEKRLSTDFIDEWEKKTKAKEADIEEGGEHCSSELANIANMRDWMQKHHKNYYSIYFVNGNDYEILD
ncbi:MAG: hypothetical protein ACEPOZ_09230 [Marinifilaceae bacterium]